MNRKKARELTAAEIAEQEAYMDAFRALAARPRRYCIVTYGCQMNERDSETIGGIFTRMGMEDSGDRTDADLVIFNTCCVRDNAERRALGNVTWLKELKRDRPGLLVAVCGCMMQQPGMGAEILRQYPFVDLAFGTANLHRLPELLYRRVTEGRRVVEVLTDDEELIPEDLPVRRLSPFHAYVTVMYGCNNFCSYCIVPYVRGRERSRDSGRVLRELRELADAGVQEVMLLGQNVNSYGLDREGELSFAELLAAADQTGIERIRFMTSHPKDISDALIETMAKSRHVCRSLHLPAQHGNDRILASMNRHYTRDIYMEKIRKLREAMPEIALSTDLIVGYPGETESEFRDTMSLVREVRYDSAFTFIYSPRAGTLAARMADQIPAEVSSRRIGELIALQKEITRERLAARIGTEERVLVEGISRRDAGQVAGKDDANITVNFPGPREWIGKFVTVRITSAGESTLRGEAGKERNL